MSQAARKPSSKSPTTSTSDRQQWQHGSRPAPLHEFIDDQDVKSVKHAQPLSDLLASSAQWPGLKDLCGAHDGRRFMTDLADNFLTKVIRASMAMSLEVRVPLIHHRVIEFASRLPKSMLFGNGCE